MGKVLVVRGTHKPMTDVEKAFARARLKELAKTPLLGSLGKAREQLSSCPVHQPISYRQKSFGQASVYTEEFMRDLFRRVTSASRPAVYQKR